MGEPSGHSDEGARTTAPLRMLRLHGWKLSGSGQEIIDHLETSTFGMARMYSETTKGVFAPSRQCSYFLLIAEGRGTLECEADTTEYESRHLMSFDTSKDYVVTSHSASIHYYFFLPARMLISKAFEFVPKAPILVSSTAMLALTSVANAILGRGTKEPSAVSPALERIIESLLAFAFEEALASRHSAIISGRDALFFQAESMIDRMYGDTEFNVQTLAARLHVGLSSLYSAYRRAGITPRRSLEQRRAKHAIAVLNEERAQGRKLLREVAKASGFSSIEQMWRAIDRSLRRKPLERSRTQR